MKLSELVNVDAIRLRLQAKTKREVIAELVDLLEAGHGCRSQGEILDRVLRREAMMTTGIGNGVAIPHGKARAAERMMAACAVAPEGLDFESEDGQPAVLFVLFVSPENAATLHVKVLANISRLFKEESVRRTLRDARTPQEFYAALQAAEAAFIPTTT